MRTARAREKSAPRHTIPPSFTGGSMSYEHFKDIIAQFEQELKQSRCHEKALDDLLEIKLNDFYAHYHISQTISSLLGMQEMLRKVTGIRIKSLPLDRVSVYLANENRKNSIKSFPAGLTLSRR
jgi:hypothetical protein